MDNLSRLYKKREKLIEMKINPIGQRLTLAEALIRSSPLTQSQGRIVAVDQNGIALSGFRPPLALRDRVATTDRSGTTIIAEVVGTRDGNARVAVLGDADGLSEGSTARATATEGLGISQAWLGRVLDPMGNPLDGQPKPPPALHRCPTRRQPPAPGLRQRLGPAVCLGVRALDCFCTMREGQRLGLFAASGVGKSTLLASLARSGDFDVTVVGLIGERGREVREFVEDDLGPAGLARSVVICATSDAAAAVRREAAFAAVTVAEHFRDQGQRVLLLLDSVTRFAQACREIGLAAGEPPATRGYPPSVFRELPALLERAGPGGPGAGSITALITVLVEGDDHDEPVADSVRGILDGHVVLDRRIAEGGRFPAIDVLRSLSRTVPGCQTAEQAALVTQARRLLALRDEVADLVRLGAYRAGTDADTDRALRAAPRIEAMLSQKKTEASSMEEAFAALARAVSDEPA
ncbi:FliI/YscN family ATPase [Falsiroseomonas ponticola]|uniref:FliI/YscN family ATPase n=1 Tax=Falsiroseomonas ponticola TaxID=2786951 RepID=UPI001CF7DA47|nr:FliI/YscN family ATPase [Roseomonas ponticola]